MVIFDEEVKDNMSRQFSRIELFKLFKKNKLKIIEVKNIGIAYILFIECDCEFR